MAGVLQKGSEMVGLELRDVGPLRPILQYCNSFCNGTDPCIKSNCPRDKMWSDKTQNCVAMSDEVRKQLLENADINLPGN